MDPTSRSRVRCNGEREVLQPSHLQERLLERRIKNTRSKRTRQSDLGPRRGHDDDIFLDEAEEDRRAVARTYDSSPLVATSRMGSDAGSSSHRTKRSFGVKDVNEQLDRLSKQNFALKLELDHRREHTVKLQERLDASRAQVERAEQLEEEHAELLRINEQLVAELEKRDRAVEEAMDIICDLEDKVTDMEEHTRPSTAHADSGYAGTETHEQAPRSSPPEVCRVPNTPHVRPLPPAASAASAKLHSVVNGLEATRVRREPTVLTLKKPSTHALRSVYLETAQDLHPVKSFNSLLSKRGSRAEEDGASDDVLNSPRLSVLSESSFPSLYSPKKQVNPDRYAWEAPDEEDNVESHNPHYRQASINRVSQWISDGDVEETPSKPNRISSPSFDRTERAVPVTRQLSDEAPFQSLDNALSIPSAAKPQSLREMLPQISHKSHPSPPPKHRAKQQTVPKSLGGPIFGEPLLPPTPDSASTGMLRASRSSIAGDRSLLDTTPVAVKGFDSLEPGVRTAPKQMRSSAELKTAHDHNVRYRDSLYDVLQDDDDDDEDSSEDDDEDARSETVKDLSLEYEGFPDGNSIIMGTPSRFLKHPAAPASNVLFTGNSMSPPRADRELLRRRQSSSEATVSPRKPSLSRAETSPTFLGTLGRIVTSGSKSTATSGDITSPRSTYSGSSGDRTVICQGDDHSNGVLSPLESTRSQSRTSALPGRTLSQRTQKLFRHLSNSHSEPRSPREKSPLPTLTSTPSAAYMNAVPKDARRPSTSQARHPFSSREEKRPSLQSRTKTEPAPDTVSVEPQDNVATPTDKGKRNALKRSDSVKMAVNTPSPAMTVEQARGGPIGGLAKRRGSIREAVSGRRHWR